VVGLHVQQGDAGRLGEAAQFFQIERVQRQRALGQALLHAAMLKVLGCQRFITNGGSPIPHDSIRMRIRNVGHGD
jgi:hypothetical protein